MITTLVGSVPTTLAEALTWASYAVAVLCVIPLCWTTLPARPPWKWLRRFPLAHRLWALRGRTAPPPATWAIWTAAGVIGALGMIMAYAAPAAWGLKLALTVGPAAVTICAIIGKVRWVVHWTDGVSIGLATIGLVALFFGGGLEAMWLAIAINIIGSVPTCRHALAEGERERYFPFACASGSVLVVLLFAIPWPWTVASVAYPLYLLIDTSTIMLCIFIGRRRAPRRVDVLREDGEALVE